jgi:integrase
MAVIEPHWLTRNETINRVRNRIELVLDWAKVRKYRDGENPARWKGNIDMLLAKRSIVAPVEGHRAVAVRDLFDFMKRLRCIDGIGARCLEFVILTVARSGEARLATWAEIDWKTRTWNIPGARMKSGRNHRVPLTDQAVSLLRALPRLEGQELIFPSRVAGKPLSDMTLLAVMRRMKVDAVPHGFRASFSSWCAATTHFPEEVREMALAHAVGNDTVGAYQRDDLYRKRRRLMAAWAQLLETPPLPDDDDVDDKANDRQGEHGEA